jgi:hypothetical protein
LPCCGADGDASDPARSVDPGHERQIGYAHGDARLRQGGVELAAMVGLMIEEEADDQDPRLAGPGEAVEPDLVGPEEVVHGRHDRAEEEADIGPPTVIIEAVGAGQKMAVLTGIVARHRGGVHSRTKRNVAMKANVEVLAKLGEEGFDG